MNALKIFADNNFIFKNFTKKQLILAVYLLPFETFVNMVTLKQMYHSLSKNYSDKGTAQKYTSSMRAVSYLLAHGDKSRTVANTENMLHKMLLSESIISI